MKLTADQLKAFRLGKKLWLHDHRMGVCEPKPVILKAWPDKYRFLLHIVDESGGFLDLLNWSLNTNAPLGEARMPINQKVWLTIRD